MVPERTWADGSYEKVIYIIIMLKTNKMRKNNTVRNYYITI